MLLIMKGSTNSIITAIIASPHEKRQRTREMSRVCQLGARAVGAILVRRGFRIWIVPNGPQIQVRSDLHPVAALEHGYMCEPVTKATGNSFRDTAVPERGAHEMSEGRVWTMKISFTKEEARTRADALLQAGDLRLRGRGSARRNPEDPDRPAVGEELAAARALSNLTHKLVHKAAVAIEEYEGRPVHLHT